MMITTNEQAATTMTTVMAAGLLLMGIMTLRCFTREFGNDMEWTTSYCYVTHRVESFILGPINTRTAAHI